MIQLSVIIVSWNTKEYLLSCLRSIIERDDGISQEVILVDNGSIDGSASEVKKVYPFVHLIENSKNLGFAKAVNQGIQKASGKYLLLLNPDTQVRRGAVEQLISFMESHPGVGVVGGQLLNSDGSRQNSIANFPTLATELFNKSLLRRWFPKKFPGKEKDYPQPIEVESVIGACMMVRRDALSLVGLLDEGYFLFLEETDWCYRMKRAGWKIFHVPQAQIFHFQGKSAESVKKKARVEYYRSRYRFFKKNRGTLCWLILLTGLVTRLMFDLVIMGMACFFTFFTIRKWKKKLSVCFYLLWWHLRVCPEGMGLKPNNRKGVRDIVSVA